MRVLLTGGAGDLGTVLVPLLRARGDTPVVLDVRACSLDGAVAVRGSILDRAELRAAMRGCDAVVHIAGWHGIHEDSGETTAEDFFDLNVRGTFEVFQAARALGIARIVQISTTSVRRPDTRYGRSKRLAEQIAGDFSRYEGMGVITLRPRGFIPYWNRSVYARYSDWARWFWRGAVHIDDVAAAILLSLDRLSGSALDRHPILTLDSAYEYTGSDLANWDVDGPGTTFRARYPGYHDLAVSYGLDPAAKPTRLDISETMDWLEYRPGFSLGCLLEELARYGDAGPPR